MHSLDALLDSLAGRSDVASLLRDFVPPPRFAAKRFDDYTPRHPSQERAEEKLRELAGAMHEGYRARRSFLLVRKVVPRRAGIYLDGGFGVGKTHLLAALWHDAPEPKAFLGFDELMHLVGLVGPGAAAEAFGRLGLIAIDEWELDDPGNLKLALAFLRRAIDRGAFVAVTSNTLPLELGAGRFSQKDFRAEIEELATAFEVVRIEGEDYRLRRFEPGPGRHHFVNDEELTRRIRNAPPTALAVEFGDLVAGLSRTHPIRYRDFVRAIGALLVRGVGRFGSLSEALRWVHFVDSIYDAGIPFVASGELPLGAIFDEEWFRGPFGKKLSRCLSRMEEMLGEDGTEPMVAPERAARSGNHQS